MLLITPSQNIISFSKLGNITPCSLNSDKKYDFHSTGQCVCVSRDNDSETARVAGDVRQSRDRPAQMRLMTCRVTGDTARYQCSFVPSIFYKKVYLLNHSMCGLQINYCSVSKYKV